MILRPPEFFKGLYLIVDPSVIALPLATLAQTINQSEVKLIQFRDKTLSKIEFCQALQAFKALLNDDKTLIANDHWDVAFTHADGVHLGQSDTPLAAVRARVPEHFIIGATCHHVTEVRQAERCGANYISVGCVFQTTSKSDVIPISLAAVTRIRQHVTLPLCAIGGINASNLASVIACEVDMVAVISSIWQSNHPLQAIKQLASAFI